MHVQVFDIIHSDLVCNVELYAPSMHHDQRFLPKMGHGVVFP